MPVNVSLLRDEVTLDTCTLSGASEVKRARRWIQSKDHPTSITVSSPGCEVIYKDLRPGQGKKQKTLSAAVKTSDATLLANVTIGWDDLRPSWNWTIEVIERGALVGCSICGELFHERFNLTGEAPVCPKCESARARREAS